MISETAFLDCENLPAEMVGRFDQPWHFVGEVRRGGPSLYAGCVQCHSRRNPLQLRFYPDGIASVCKPVPIVSMKGYPFITDDMIEVVVYFGVCDDCDAVHWARQGPPFKRARRRVTA